MRFPAHFYKSGPASGPGIHTDEASSALPNLIYEGLPLADARLLKMVSVGAFGARTNPSEHEDWGPKPKKAAVKKPPLPKGVVPVGPATELVRLAFLCTGQWGTERATLRRHLPLAGARENPALERLTMTFFERMSVLRDALLAQRRLYTERYDANEVLLRAAGLTLKALAENQTEDTERTGPPAKMRGWVGMVDDMLVAVEFLLAQKNIPASERTIVSENGFLGLDTWSDLAKDGNQKLPFVAYSELPMATCPGAGACGVGVQGFDKEQRQVYRVSEGGEKVVGVNKETGKVEPRETRKGEKVPVMYRGKPRTVEVPAGQRGWCYSFTAWRYPDAFRRQALNTLANYADREFAILSHGGPADPTKYAARVDAAIRGVNERVWPQWIESRALHFTARDRAAGKRVFMRLFVDGDINTEDNIVAWMRVFKRLEGRVEGYGYSKCWQQFINVHKTYGASFWPSNYVVNLSSGSVYASSAFDDIRTAMQDLPISRGYFEAVNLHDGYIKELREQTALLAKNPNAVIEMPPPKAKFEQFTFSPRRIETLLRINAVETLEQAVAIVPSLKLPAGFTKKDRANPEKIRQRAFQAWLTAIVHDPDFGALVRLELVKDDAKQKMETTRYAMIQAREREKLIETLTTGTKNANDFALDKLTRKALSLVLQETLWTFGLGGSCPLVCGNCSDDPKDATQGVHRCAAKQKPVPSPFWHAKIHIGLH